MNRNEIAFLLRQMIASGKLMSKSSTGLSYSVINKKISQKELFPTSFQSIVCTDEAARDKFEALVAQKRILDGAGVKLTKKILTLYAINIACANGEMLRFADLGNSAVLYID